MGFGDQIKKFTDAAKTSIDPQAKTVEANARAKLAELLGDDISLIKSICLDADVGKFHSVDAPVSIVDRIHAAGLLKD